MIQLDELYDGEIISLKKGKNGLVTIKIQTNNKQGEQKNGFFNFFAGHNAQQSGHYRSHIPGRIPGNIAAKEACTEDSRREESGGRKENRKARSEDEQKN